MATEMAGEKMLAMLEALDNPHRLRIVALLDKRRVHVSQLAREMGMSRPLLYMHLKKLEKAGMIHGEKETGDDGKIMHYVELVPFELVLTPALIKEVLGRVPTGD